MIKDSLTNCSLYFGVHKNFEKAFNFIKKVIIESLPVGSYEIDGKDVYAMVQEYNTKLENEAKNEGHKNYVDIQFVVFGKEMIEVIDISKVNSKVDYNPEKDVQFYFDGVDATKCILCDGEYVILFPHDIHKPGMAIREIQSPVKKVVVKVKV